MSFDKRKKSRSSLRDCFPFRFAKSQCGTLVRNSGKERRMHQCLEFLVVALEMQQ
jgi:hypothetical protein